MVGNPLLKIRVSADVPVAKLAVRLTQVTPEWKVLGMTWDCSTSRIGTRTNIPSALEPRRSYDVEVPLTFMSQRLQAGNRLRVALSENFWPLVWPSPRIATFTIQTGISSLVLPVRPPQAVEDAPQMAVLRNKVRDRNLVNARGDLEESNRGRTRGLGQGRENIRAAGRGRLRISARSSRRGWTPALLEMQTGAPKSCKWTGGFTTSYQRERLEDFDPRRLRADLDRGGFPPQRVRPGQGG